VEIPASLMLHNVLISIAEFYKVSVAEFCKVSVAEF